MKVSEVLFQPTNNPGGKWDRYTLRNSCRHRQKINIELPHDPATPLLGIYPKELKARNQTESCTPVFIALFTIAGKVETTQMSTLNS